MWARLFFSFVWKFANYPAMGEIQVRPSLMYGPLYTCWLTLLHLSKEENAMELPNSEPRTNVSVNNKLYNFNNNNNNNN